MNEREVGTPSQDSVLDRAVSADGRNPDDAVLVADVSWQYMTPEQQWDLITNENR